MTSGLSMASATSRPPEWCMSSSLADWSVVEGACAGTQDPAVQASRASPVMSRPGLVLSRITMVSGFVNRYSRFL
eukprot:scaffold202138_cov39-Prasinocladus_malaysianus.AAC.1